MTIDISEESLAKESADLLKILLKDRTTKKSIVWATHSYELLGKGFAPSDRINPSKVTGNFANLIQPRSEKSKYEQKDRTKIRAEVFTPTWLVAKQNGYVESKLGSLSLEEYVDLRWLEVTCGEAPYMVTRYDTVTGEEIPLSERVGFVDRKLQRISREVSDEVTFYKLVKDAYHASYGYEYQGDSLLLARENLLATFEDYYLAKTGNQPTLEQKKEIATIISYNVFQMDGLKKSSPYSAKQKQSQQLSLFADELEVQEVEESKTHIKDWKKNRMIGFERLSSEESEMKFDVVIGNPPYQETGEARDEPIYHFTPARFLFKAGQTPKNWMEKMLEDKHLKVQFYELKSGKVFTGTDIKGGVAITYRDVDKDLGPIGVFTIFETLNGIVKKIEKHPEFETFSDLVYPQGIYRFSNKLFSDYPNAEKLQGKGTKNKIVSKSLTQLDFVFKNNEEKDHVALLGRIGSERVYRYINKKYLDLPETFENYNVFVPEANGSGALGEVLSTPLIGEPLIGHTDTFLSIGNFKTKFEADACIKFIKTKFARVLLGVLKVTQHNSRKTWYYVPLQDFTVNSDIDWTQSVTDIDRQLDQKYDLSPEEIAFIENHVREMD
ncbi:TPA: Eco57I restriction-modification methylase domain-containing protein [Streptococcus pneumoniae]|uniref:Eco57I restriction-modification methylase domain-containing protein n=1 Tax=Streptococcus pneumoniae TaxID=1313 RepID=UPI002C3BED25|nr:Eco57I restriction-modification methylase domain-containing protein [Streptococcus pneumoniae]HEW1531145.1 Eco57I restriction-modification methylase domain-containing protein [Streptococcus pneumoniae]HEW1759675.1 Eco57I restriction-modification methylase domain-containing protein [Streptococcus pneumoniae]HEW2933250.1 Eco57I restriction-modification methylase domain-containing protein [Streptococcus pneumoniae]HEW4273542.1 Eco57I restriction-modification methylase domain-containing protein 